MLRKLLILLLVLTATGCATHAVTSGRVVVRDDGAPAGLRFQERDRAMVVEYFRASKRNKALPTPVKREQLPPGLAKRDTLPLCTCTIGKSRPWFMPLAPSLIGP